MYSCTQIPCTDLKFPLHTYICMWKNYLWIVLQSLFKLIWSSAIYLQIPKLTHKLNILGFIRKSTQFMLICILYQFCENRKYVHIIITTGLHLDCEIVTNLKIYTHTYTYKLDKSVGEIPKKALKSHKIHFSWS